MSTIPASEVVAVTPSVIGAGGSALDLIGVILSTSTRAPLGSVLAFPSAAAVSTYFGPTSTEAAAASIYFSGFDNSNVKPGAVWFAQYPAVAVAAYLRSGSLSAMTLVQLQALNGVLTATVNGVANVSAAISLAAATSFSNAATIIQAAFTLPGFAVSYDSVSAAFVFTNTLTGAASTQNFASGSLAAGLKLTQATGAVLSQGGDVATPAAFMNTVVAQTTNWATFMTLFDPDGSSGNTLKGQFSAWTNTQANRWMYVCWDTDVTPTISTQATTSLGYLLKQSQASGTYMIYGFDWQKAAFICGSVASLDFTQTDGRATLAFKHQQGLTADVSDDTIYRNLLANGYNSYGVYATANSQFLFMSNGQVTGQFRWADSYVNQIWLNNSFQLALVTLLTQMKSIPYNAAGYALIRAACMDPINQALNFGAIRAGVPLSSLQAAEVNTAAGLRIDGTLATQGWYLQILPAIAQVRGARKSPPCTFWYMDGGSVQTINLASVEIQ